jgi:predicted AAA+ superfamily ATPase
MFKRPIYEILAKRTAEPRRFIQALIGPRQAGKTTLARQLMEDAILPGHYASADEPLLKDHAWIEQQWEVARAKARDAGRTRKTMLVLDEVQKIQGWSEAVKRLWDEDSASRMPLQVVILGSSQLLMEKGLTESLAGRFEVVPVNHWSFGEMKEAFGWGIDQYVFYGGYPGAADLIADPARWRSYVMDSLIETTVSRDILLMTRVDKPALLRRVFEMGCVYSGQVLSYQKMLGQLQDAGNTTTLAHYLYLLESAGLLVGLNKYSAQRIRQRSSSPKFQVLNTGLMSALSGLNIEEAQKNTEYWGRLIESSVGASLYNGMSKHEMKLLYWAGRNREVDFILLRGRDVVAIEVKSGRKKLAIPGMEEFSRQFKVKRKLLVGVQGIPLEEFLLVPVEHWFK